MHIRQAIKDILCIPARRRFETPMEKVDKSYFIEYIAILQFFNRLVITFLRSCDATLEISHFNPSDRPGSV